MWRIRLMSIIAVMALVAGVAALTHAQNPSGSTSGGSPSTTTARVETAPLELSAPEKFQAAASVLEPVRRVTIMAPADGIVRSLPLAVGSPVRDGQELADLDRAEAKVRLKVAEASVKEMQAEVKGAPGRSPSELAIAEARLDAARARAEIAQLELDRCSLRAPFGGRLLSLTVSTGQYVAKGTALGELADVSSFRVLVPIDRTAVKSGSTLDLVVEGKTVPGKIQTVLPLPESFAVLRELATPWAAAVIAFDNPGGALEPGQRVRGPWFPDAPIATVASRALRKGSASASGTVQVLRNDYVTNVAVHVLGPTGPERIQVSGPFRPNDLLIVETSVPLAAGSFLRFDTEGVARPVEGHNPPQSENGAVANITPPSNSNGRIAPIGSPGAAPPSKPSSASRSAAKPSGKAPAKSAIPF